MSKRLSGWARLWIMSTLAMWAAGVAHMYFADEYNEVMLPPVFMARDELCAFSWGSEELSPTQLARDACLTNEALHAEAQSWAWRRFQLRWQPYLPYWVAPFVLGVLLIGASWVRRGFTN